MSQSDSQVAFEQIAYGERFGQQSEGTPQRDTGCSRFNEDYRGRKVVKGVSFGVRAGEIVGILGPNGAGKTTCGHFILFV